jgi:DNA-binding Lrp family transcriptional regulator
MDHLSFPPPTSNGLPGHSAAELDDVDRAIVRELRADGRMSMRTLAERVRVSRSNVYARVDRLVADGVITGFTAQIDPLRIGLGTAAYVMVTIDQHAWRNVLAELRDVPYVEHLTLVGGEADLVMLVRTPDNVTLRDIVLARITTVEGVRSTRTWLIFDEVPGAIASGNHRPK